MREQVDLLKSWNRYNFIKLVDEKFNKDRKQREFNCAVINLTLLFIITVIYGIGAITSLQGYLLMVALIFSALNIIQLWFDEKAYKAHTTWLKELD